VSVDRETAGFVELAAWAEEQADRVGDLVACAYLDGLGAAAGRLDGFDPDRAAEATARRAEATDAFRQLAAEIRAEGARHAARMRPGQDPVDAALDRSGS
jgi:hypothetical protein